MDAETSRMGKPTPTGKTEKEAIIVNSNELILDVLVAARNIIFHPRYWTKYTDARKFVPSLTVYNTKHLSLIHI